MGCIRSVEGLKRKTLGSWWEREFCFQMVFGLDLQYHHFLDLQPVGRTDKFELGPRDCRNQSAPVLSTDPFSGDL